MANKILKIKTFRLVKNYFFICLFLEMLLLGGYFCLYFINKELFSWTTFGILGTVVAVLMIGFSFLGIKSTFYEITNNSLIRHYGNKIIEYRFENIVFIEEKAYGKGNVEMYDYMGNYIYLMLDEDKTLIKLFREKCKNLITEEEFNLRFKKR